MKDKKKNILHYVPGYNYGGIESLTELIGKNMSNTYTFTYLVEKNINEKVKKSLLQDRSTFIRVPNLTNENPIKHILAVRKVIKNGHFDVVHVHDANVRFFVMYFSKKFGIRNRVYHIHSKRIENVSFFKKIGLKLNMKYATSIIACSKGSIALVPEKFKDKTIVMQNVIDEKKFRFNNKARTTIRTKNNVKKNELLLGTIGRLAEVKNQAFLLKVLEKCPNTTKLIIVGSGPLEESLKKEAHEHGIFERVLFVGEKENTNDYYSAMDIFCLPSYSEGCPMTILEAQSNGIPIITSPVVEEDFFARPNYIRSELNIDSWVNSIIKLSKSRIKTVLNDDKLSIEKYTERMSKIYES